MARLKRSIKRPKKPLLALSIVLSVTVIAMVIANARQVNSFIRWARAGGSFNLGIVDSLNGYPEAAANRFTSAINLDPNFLSAYEQRSLVNIELGNYDAAIADAEKVIASRGSEVSLDSPLGEAYLGAGEYANAIDYYSKVVADFPQSVVSYVSLGNAHYWQKNYWESLAAFDRAIDISGGWTEAYWGRGIVSILLFGANSAAQEDLSTVFSLWDDTSTFFLQPGHASAYISLGMVDQYLGDGNRAIELINQAIELEPQSIYVYIARGQIYNDTQRYQLGLEDYQKALQLIGADKRFGVGVSLLRDAETQAMTIPNVIDATNDSLEVLQADDEILAVDGQKISDLTFADIQTLISGPYDSTVTLQISREQEGTFEVELSRRFDLKKDLLAETLAGHGVAYSNLGDFQRADSYCQQMQELESVSAYAYDLCGGVYRNNNKNSLAIESLNKALALYAKQGNETAVENIKAAIEALTP